MDKWFLMLVSFVYFFGTQIRVQLCRNPSAEIMNGEHPEAHVHIYIWSKEQT